MFVPAAGVAYLLSRRAEPIIAPAAGRGPALAEA
jgi:hypothetical protein